MRIILLIIISLILLVSLSLNWHLLSVMMSVDQSQSMHPTIKYVVEQLRPQSSSTLQPKQITQAIDPQTTFVADIADIKDADELEDAMIQYEELRTTDSVVANKIRSKWLNQVRVGIKQQAFFSVSNFLNFYLHRYPTDIDFLAQEAEMIFANGDLGGAIERFYHLVNVAATESEQEAWLQKIHQLVLTHHSSLKTQMAWQHIIDFTQPLLWQETDYPPYLLALSEAHIALGEVEQAESHLQLLVDDPLYSFRAQRLLDDIQALMAQEDAIPLTAKGSQFVVEVEMGNGSGESAQIDLLIDTGASLTVISESAFERIPDWQDSMFIGDTQLSTAGGLVVAPRYMIRRFSVGQFAVDNIEVVVLDIDEADRFDGLLGMNYLKQFRFHIDQQQQVLMLAPNLR